MKLKYIFICLSLIYSTSIFAQNSSQITLLDADTNAPIQGATYQYGSQKGSSDKNGIIAFTPIDGETMKLSHASYGSWKWNASELSQIIKQKTYHRQNQMLNLYPVTVVGLRSNPNPNQSIDFSYRDRMEHDEAAILDQLPEINSIKKSGSYGFDPVFRGFKYNQLNIVVDGIQGATAACPSRMDPPASQMTPNMMDRIEVLKGPYSLRYGVGVGGTINFISSKPKIGGKKKTYGRVSSEYKANGNVSSSEGKLGFSEKKYDLNFLGAWAKGHDYKTGDNETVDADFQRSSFGGNFSLQVSPDQQLRISAVYNMGKDVDFPSLGMDLRKDNTLMLNAHYDITLHKKYLKSWNTTLFGSFVDHVMDNLLKPSATPRMMSMSSAIKTSNFGGRTEGKWIFSNSKLYAGVDFRGVQADGTTTMQYLMGSRVGETMQSVASWQDSYINNLGFYGEFHFSGNFFQYIVSGRLDINEANAHKPSTQFSAVHPKTEATQLNPSLSLGVLKTVSEKIKVGLWMGRALRSGSLIEKFINYSPVGQDPYELVGLPLIKPEINNQADLTFKWETQNSSLNIDLFVSYLQDYISSVIDPTLTPIQSTSPGVRQFINIDEALKIGFEVNWAQNLFAGLSHQIGVAYTYGEDLERNEALPEIAPLDLVYSLQGNYLNGKLKPRITFRHVLEQKRISKEFGETETPDFSLLDFDVVYQLAHNIRFTAGINNLLDTNYYEHLTRSVRGTNKAIYAPGRNIFASFSLSF